MERALQNQKQVAEPAPWERAHKTLDTLADEMRGRLNDIEQQQLRLAGEAEAIRVVLNRIQSPPPQPINPSYGATASSQRY